MELLKKFMFSLREIGSPQPTNSFNLKNAQLRNAEDPFRLMVNSVKDYAIFMMDLNGYIQSWNEGARRIKGYEAHEILGKHFSNFYTQADKDRHHPEFELKLAIGEGRYEEEGWRVKKDGSQFWASVVITRIDDANGKPVGFAKVTRDLTEKRQTLENSPVLLSESAYC